MTTINYKDPSLLATILANGMMSSDDKIKLANLIITFDGYATIGELQAETARAEAAEYGIRIALDGYGHGEPAELDGYATISYVNNILDGYAPNKNLTNIKFVDVGTVVSIVNQNGNVETPFSTITAAVAATPKTNSGLVLCLVPGDYTSENSLNPIDLTGCGQTTVMNLGYGTGAAGAFAIQNLVQIRTLENNAMIVLQGCQILNAFPDSMQLRSSINIGNIQVNSGFWAESSMFFNDGVTPNLTSFGGPVRFDSCKFQTGGDVIFKTDNVNPIELYNCTLTSAIGIHFTGSAGILRLDNFTYQQWLGLGCTLSNGTISIIDPSAPLAHAPTHIAGGSDPLDGYHIPLSYIPVNYAAPIDGYIGEHIAKIDKQIGLNAPAYSTVSVDVGLTAAANVLIDTRPSSPSGAGRWKLISIDIRVKVAISGSGSPNSVISVGSTSGGQQIVTNQTVDGYKTVGTNVGGLALLTLGSDMGQSNGFEALYPASQQIYANVAPSGSPSTGTVTIYLIWQGLL